MNEMEECGYCGGDGELTFTGESIYEFNRRRSTAVGRLDARMTHARLLAKQYREEGGRNDPRIAPCVLEIKAYHASIHQLRLERQVDRTMMRAWCVACRGLGVARTSCEICHEPVTRGDRHGFAFFRAHWLMHKTCLAHPDTMEAVAS